MSKLRPYSRGYVGQFGREELKKEGKVCTESWEGETHHSTENKISIVNLGKRRWKYREVRSVRTSS